MASQSKGIQALARLHNYFIDIDNPPLDAIGVDGDHNIGVESMSVGKGVGEAALGNLGFFGYDGLDYDNNEGASACQRTCSKRRPATTKSHCEMA
jgi:hypothetical protein